MSSTIKLVVGLGNPGTKYINTRHNAGIWCIESLATGQFFQSHKKLCAEIVQHAEYGMLCKPMLFMNENGTTVYQVARYYKILPSETLIIHDEIDLSLGIVRLKQGGGHGGHNGLGDVITKFGSPDFLRIRIGIGRPSASIPISDYVLGMPGSSEKKLILAGIERLLPLMPLICVGKVTSAMNKLHSD